MDRIHILEQLALPSMTPIYLTELTLRQWGRDLIFFCEADDTQFTVTFSDCRETKWQIYTHMQDTGNNFPRSQWVNFRMGRDQHRSPAHILSEHFGLSLVYGKMVVEKEKVEG